MVLGDDQRLVQVFVNLLSNARVPASLDKPFVSSRNRRASGGVAHYRSGTWDSGRQGRPYFRTFFTTKDVGKGTGLGLSLVYSIIEEHYGHIAIESPVAGGRGTCVGSQSATLSSHCKIGTRCMSHIPVVEDKPLSVSPYAACCSVMTTKSPMWIPLMPPNVKTSAVTA